MITARLRHPVAQRLHGTLIGQPGFRRLWFGQTVSAFGSQLTTLALPLLDSMVPAFADTKTLAARPVRLGFVYVPNGIIMDRWTPNADGASFEFTPTSSSTRPSRSY